MRLGKMTIPRKTVGRSDCQIQITNNAAKDIMVTRSNKYDLFRAIPSQAKSKCKVPGVANRQKSTEQNYDVQPTPQCE